jgi:hypothetical protein
MFGWAFRAMGVTADHSMLNLLKNMYKNASLTVHTKMGTTDSITQERGIRQGCPLSPLLFIFAIDPLLRWMESLVEGYCFSAKKSVCLKAQGYADDLVFICQSQETVEKIAWALGRIKDVFHLQANAAKCGILPLSYSAVKSIPPIWIGENTPSNRVPVVQEYKYLGHTVHSHLAHWQHRSTVIEQYEKQELKSLNALLKTIKKCQLSNVQKLRMLKWMGFGRIRFLAAATSFRISFLKTCNTRVKEIAREIFKLPPGTEVAFFHSDIQDGGLGMPDLCESLTLQRLRFWTELVSQDSLIKDIAVVSVYGEAEHLQIPLYDPHFPNVRRGEAFTRWTWIVDKNKQGPWFFGWLVSNPEAPAYAHVDKECQGLWYWYEAAKPFLKMKLSAAFSDENIKKHHNPKGLMRFAPVIQERIRTPETGLKVRHSLLHNNNWLLMRGPSRFARLKSLISSVRDLQAANQFATLTKPVNDPEGMKGFQGDIFRTLSTIKSERRRQLKPTADLIRFWNRNVSDKMIILMLKSRLQLIGNALYSRIYKNRQQGLCPRPGCLDKEWTNHIFNGCKMATSQFKARHDAVQDVLVEALKKTATNVIVDKATLENDRHRPDISHAEVEGRIQIGEFTVPYDKDLVVRRQGKIDKYRNWIRQYSNSVNCTKPVNQTLAVFVIGSLGTLDTQLFNNLKLYGIKDKEATKVASEMAYAALKGSYKIWVSRCKEKWKRRPPRYIRASAILIRNT